MTTRREILKNLRIQFNANIFKRFQELKLSMEHVGSIIFILFALYEERYDLLDAFDDSNRERRAVILYDHMVIKGLIRPALEDEDVNFALTDKGIELIDFVKSEFEKEHAVIQVEELEVQAEKEVDQSPATWVADWLELFPKGKVNGRYLRTNKTECLEKLKWFMKTYDYDRDTIFRATKAYLDTQASSEQGHTFTRNSSYFISKQLGNSRADKISDLATWCERVKDNDVPESQEDVFNRLI